MVWTFGYEAMSPAGPSHLFASLLLGVLLTIIFMPGACPLPLALVPQNTLAWLQLDEKASAHPRPLQLLGRVEPGSRQVLGAELEFHQQQWVGSRPDFHYLLCVLARDPVMDSEGPSEGLPSMPGSGRPGDPWGPGTQSLPTLLTSPHRLCPLQLADGVNSGQGLGIEIIGTLQLVLCVLATTDRRRRDLGGSAPLAIGLSVALGHLLAIDYTGCGINPARSFGSAVITHNFSNHWIFWVGPFIGGALAVLIYDFILAPRSSDFTDRVKVWTSGQVEEYDLDADDINSRVEMKPK
ncbi:aquaporin-1 isoform X1 [Macaca fascicularis]|uniref:aquaporin-1 isoform X1 n=1 Tax=Macaca fascicularis TaxID=9541 RepID=UPI0032B05B2A